MKFSAEKNILAEAVINASKACAVKTAFSALDGGLLSLRGNRLTVTGAFCYFFVVCVKICMIAQKRACLSVNYYTS